RGRPPRALSRGRPPSRGPRPRAAPRAVWDEEPTAIRRINPDVPAWLESVIARLMAKDPADRFQTAAEVAGLLEGYLAHPPLASVEPEETAPVAARPSRWGVAALVLLSLLSPSSALLLQVLE